MYPMDLLESYREGGNVPLTAIAGGFGAGVQTYDAKKKRPSKKKPKGISTSY